MTNEEVTIQCNKTKCSKEPVGAKEESRKDNVIISPEETGEVSV